MTGDGPRTRSMLARLGERQERRLAAAVWHADRPMAVGWFMPPDWQPPSARTPDAEPASA